MGIEAAGASGPDPVAGQDSGHPPDSHETAGIEALDDEARATFAGLADVMIPAGEDMPSASEAGVAGHWLDEVLRSRADLADDLVRLVRRAAGRDPAEAIAAMRERDPASFEVLTVVVPGAYFLNPDVRRRIGYPGQRPIPIDPDAPPEHEQDGLLDVVRARGPIYRRPPEG